MDDDGAVARQAHVEFETIRSQSETIVERLDRILGPQRGAAPVRIDERSQGHILIPDP